MNAWGPSLSGINPGEKVTITFGFETAFGGERLGFWRR